MNHADIVPGHEELAMMDMANVMAYGDAFVFLKNEKHIGWTDEEKQQLMFICSLFLLSYQLVHVMWCHYQHCFG